MRKLLIMSAALMAGALSLPAMAAQQSTATEGTKLTGTVTEVSKDKQQITINGQQLRMEMGGGAAMMPNVGDTVTLYYQERNGEKTVTRIGQAQEGASGQSGQQTAANEDNKVTGTVTEASKDKQQITVDGQKFRMEMGGGAAMMPNVGDKVTLYYEERDGQKTVTRIGQAQQ
jgi:ribosomal 50S subunit-recycling heat shock protein